MININSSTADKVAAAIARSGQSVAGIAEATLIPRSTLQRKISGKSKFTIDELYFIAKALGVKTRTLIPDEIINESSEAA